MLIILFVIICCLALSISDHIAIENSHDLKGSHQFSYISSSEADNTITKHIEFLNYMFTMEQW